jgi:hypothetical protein
VTSHIALLLVFSVLVSATFAVLSRDSLREQAWFAARLFGAFVGAAYVLGWLLYPLPL